ncbi:MAG: beta-eliminating lyase-related protein, partial [Pseudomonadota bacterium]
VAVHMDGTRFANALAATNATPAELSWRAGVDALCLGFTKNGALAAEAVILFDPARGRELELRRKRAGHLFSKMRFMTAQVEAMMADGLWLRLAGHANAMAARLAAGVAATPGAAALHPVEANLMFVTLPKAAHDAAVAAGARYYDMAHGEDGTVTARLVCSFATTEDDVDRLIAAFRSAG